MKAMVFTKYGSPDVLKLKEVEKPAPKENEVLVKVHAASVNPLDWHVLRGKPFLVRLTAGFIKPKNTILGADFAGRVEAIGSKVKQFREGDEVFGDMYPNLGTFAEYICVAENGTLVPKSIPLTFEEAAAVPAAAVSALQGLRDKGQIQAGQKVLINGASGGVGTFAVQIAKSLKTEVTGVCSTRNLNLVGSIGADQVVDYTQEDFTRDGQQYDLILDAVGNRSCSDLKRALKPHGTCVIIGYTSPMLLLQHTLQAPWISMTSTKKIVPPTATKTNKNDLSFMKELLEESKVVPVIDRHYPLSEVPEAIRYLEEGHARGKVVIIMEDNSKT